jgi:hypothetical protein
MSIHSWGQSVFGSANEQESEYIQKPEVKIVIPDVLKLQLVDDWENVTKNNQASHPDMNVVNEDSQISW